MRRLHGRDGFGLILAITTLFLITWGVTGLCQMTFSGQVTDSVQSATTGSMAVAFGQTAIEEAFHQVSKRVNQPGDPLFTSLREEYLSKQNSYKAFQVKPSLCLAVLAKDPLYAGFELGGGAVEVKLLSERPLTTLTYESRGTLEFTARVKHGATHIARTVRETRGFKVALVTTPRPFDQVTWLLRHPWRLFESFRGEANQNIAQSLNVVKTLDDDRVQKAGQVFAMLQNMNIQVKDANDAINDLNTKYSSYVGHVDERAQFWMQQNTEQPMRSATIPQDPGFRGTDVTADYHKFPEELILYSIAPTLPALSKQYYLPPQVSTQNQRIDEQAHNYEAASNDLAKTYDRARQQLVAIQQFRDRVDRCGSLGEAKRLVAHGRRMVRDTNQVRQFFAQACQGYSRAASQLAQEHKGRWDIYNRFTKAFMKVVGPKFREMAAYDSKFDVATSEVSQAGRAFFRFTGAKAADRCVQFLADSARAGGRPLNATVFVDNADEPLRLAALRFHGKLSISASGPVEMSDLTLADPANDLLTVHVAAGRTVRISGRVQASVMSAGTVDLAEGALLIGNLIQWDAAAPANLNGTIQADPRYYSGVSSTRDQRLDHFVVALHPMPSSRVIARN
ncbi:MAG: hypothetical protein HY303_12520 [Candidatus Wallbacteria bacterium]|nr:hypothetical protein [Candidatus Wallbacteria bacterium]